MARIEIVVDIDEKGAIKGVQQISGETEKLDKNVRAVGKSGSKIGEIFRTAFGFIIAQAVMQASRALRKFITDLSRLAEEIADIDSAFKTMFRNVAASADRTEKNISKMVGISTTESRKFITEISGIGLAMNGTLSESIALSEEVGVLTAQWEKISGLPIKEGIEAVTQAMSGQFRSLRRRGIILSEQRIAERALIMTGKENEKQLRDIERAQATVALITEAVTRQYGDLSKATDGLTQNKRRLRTEFVEVRDLLIRGLIPSMNRLLQFTNDLLGRNKDLSEELKTGLLIQLKAMDEILGTILNTFSDSDKNLGLFGMALSFINDQLNEISIRSGRAIIGIATLLKHLPQPLRAGAIAFGLTTERLDEMAEAGARLIMAGTGIQKMLDDLKPPLEDQQEDLEELAAIIREDIIPLTREMIDQLTLFSIQSADVDLSHIESELERLHKELLKTEDPARRRALIDLRDRLRDIRDEAMAIDSSQVEVMMDALLRARDVVLRFGDDGRVSITEMDGALKQLNDEIMITEDPQRRAALIEWRDRLREVRDETVGLQKDTDDYTTFLQTTMANALSQTLIEFTNLFEAVGDGSEKMAQAVLKSLLAIIRGIGQQLIAWGTTQLIMSAGADPRGWSAIAYGTALAGLASLATGAIKGGGGGGSTSGGGSGRQTRSAGVFGAAPSTRNIADTGGAAGTSLLGIPQKIKITVDGKLDGADINISGERTVRLRRRIGD